MIDLSKAVLPSSVEVGGRFFPIHTDFRFWVRFREIVEAGGQNALGDFDFLYDGDAPDERQKGFDALMRFAYPKNPLPRGASSQGGKILDFELDGDLILAAFWEQYGIDLMDATLRLHWHKFLALLRGLHSTKLNDVMGWRCYRKPPKRSDQHAEMMRLKSMWEIREEIELTEEERAEEEAFFASLTKC